MTFIKIKLLQFVMLQKYIYNYYNNYAINNYQSIISYNFEVFFFHFFDMRRYAAYDIFRPRVASTINCTCFTQALSLTQGVVRESRISILGSYHPSQVITCSVNTTKKGTYFGSYTNQPKNNACI